MNAAHRLPNLLFDFGGVIINIDYNRTLEAMRALSRVGSTIEFTQAAQSALFDDLETGRITPDAFRQGLRTHYDLQHATDAELDAAWNAMLLDLPLERLEYLRELRREGYQTALLSNTNSIHIGVINEMLRRAYGLQQGIADVLDRVFYSQEVGQRKPGREIFEHVLREMNWRAEETLFVEDSIQHIRTAEQLGIRTLFLTPPLTLTDALPAALRAFPNPVS
ncbi:HAD family phosphatase [Hymenobacter sp. 15J16-1T3B]|uniref:HAD family hydrolase n=1 Tax=Hymenobacter sp. 15J16-1T3B TaxID=2886941 RepID=UPI001D10743B|nr:HAD family phosphatase [Hymenobacter sp. 15J16-1T3B]MCC3158632.1 HAD family phosphatase [Hymenobacter sp. 15J16-1T3B]